MQEVDDLQRLKEIMEAMKNLTSNDDTNILVSVSVGKQRSVMIKGNPIDIMANLCTTMEHDGKTRTIIGSAVDVFRKHDGGIQTSPKKSDPGYVN